MRIECGANERRRNEQTNANNSLAGSFTPFPSLFHPLQRVEISFRVGFPFAPDFKLDLCWCMLNRHHADERCSVSYCSRHYFYSQIDTQNRFNHCRHVKSNANNSVDVCERERVSERASQSDRKYHENTCSSPIKICNKERERNEICILAQISIWVTQERGR